MIGHFKNYQIDTTLSVAEDILFCLFQDVITENQKCSIA